MWEAVRHCSPWEWKTPPPGHAPSPHQGLPCLVVASKPPARDVHTQLSGTQTRIAFGQSQARVLYQSGTGAAERPQGPPPQVIASLWLPTSHHPGPA